MRLTGVSHVTIEVPGSHHFSCVVVVATATADDVTAATGTSDVTAAATSLVRCYCLELSFQGMALKLFLSLSIK